LVEKGGEGKTLGGRKREKRRHADQKKNWTLTEGKKPSLILACKKAGLRGAGQKKKEGGVSKKEQVQQRGDHLKSRRVEGEGRIRRKKKGLPLLPQTKSKDVPKSLSPHGLKKGGREEGKQKEEEKKVFVSSGGEEAKLVFHRSGEKGKGSKKKKISETKIVRSKKEILTPDPQADAGEGGSKAWKGEGKNRSKSLA